MCSQIAQPVEPDDRVPALTAPPVSNDCDQALHWFHSWVSTFKPIFNTATRKA